MSLSSVFYLASVWHWYPDSVRSHTVNLSVCWCTQLFDNCVPVSADSSCSLLFTLSAYCTAGSHMFTTVPPSPPLYRSQLIVSTGLARGDSSSPPPFSGPGHLLPPSAPSPPSCPLENNREAHFSGGIYEQLRGEDSAASACDELGISFYCDLQW